MSQPQAKFRLIKMYVQESSFKQDTQYGDKFDVKIKPSAKLDQEKKEFKLSLDVRVGDDAGKFEAYVHYIGLFEFSEDMQEGELDSYFLLNAPALLFPYIRAYIAAMTALSGHVTITLPAFNLSNLKEDLKANIIQD